MATNQTTSVVLTPRTPLRQGLTVSNIKPDRVTLFVEQRSAQQHGNGVEGPDSSSGSFVSAEENMKIARLEISVCEIGLEREKLRKEIDQSRRQHEAIRRKSAALERQVQDLKLKASEGAKDLKRQVTELTAKVQYHESGRVQTYQNGVVDGMRSQVSTNERTILLQQVEAYKAEAAKWRMEAYRQGSEAISQCWQASVDEAVRREREKDALVMALLRDEIAALKSKKEGCGAGSRKYMPASGER